MSVHELSEKSILKRKRVKQFQNAKVFPGLVGFHSEPNLRDVQISITKKNDLKTLAMKRKMSMSGDISNKMCLGSSAFSNISSIASKSNIDV